MSLDLWRPWLWYYLYYYDQTLTIIMSNVREAIDSLYLALVVSRGFYKEKLTQLCWQYAHLHVKLAFLFLFFFRKRTREVDRMPMNSVRNPLSNLHETEYSSSSFFFLLSHHVLRSRKRAIYISTKKKV